MESSPPVKPPWCITPAAWQRPPPPPLSGFKPPPFEFGPWQETPSAELLAAKEAITPLEASRKWELIKKMVNSYEMVFTHDDPHFHPSLSVLKPLSRSYFKMVEMLTVLQFFEQLPKQTPKIRTAHVAEGPGGFIQAVVNATERNRKLLQQATAMTLKPTDSFVPGWRRAAAFLHNHREVKLHFGADGTGDVYLRENQDSFVATAGPGVDLFTADGGFDFSINYTVQEQKVYRLLVCSALTGLRSLSKGGSFVIKLFDCFSESTEILILLMARAFKEWILYKPAFSRPCNSERYFLGRGFRGCTPELLAALDTIQQESAVERYPRGLTGLATEAERAYLEEHKATNIAEQMAAFKRAEAYIQNPDLWYKDQMLKDFETSLHWCRQFHIPTQIIKPLPIKNPVRREEFLPSLSRESTSSRAAGQQSQLPGADSDSLVPSCPAS